MPEIALAVQGDPEPDEGNQVHLIYKVEGEPNEIPIFDLAKTLEALGTVIQEANRVVGQSHSEVAIAVKPFEEGSFTMDVVLFLQNHPEFLFFLNSQTSIEQIKKVLEYIGLIKKGREAYATVKDVIAAMRGERPAKADKQPDGSVTFHDRRSRAAGEETSNPVDPVPSGIDSEEPLRQTVDVSLSWENVRMQRGIVAVVVLLMAAVILSGFVWANRELKAEDEQVHLRLLAVAEGKAAQVASWRLERLGDAQVTARAFSLIAGADRLLAEKASPDEQARIRSWLNEIRARYGYRSAVIVGTNGEILLTSGAEEAHAIHVGDAFRRALASDGPVMEDLLPAVNGLPTHLTFDSAIRSETGEPLGVIHLGIEPTTALNPILREWPGGGETGELGLIRRIDGAVYVFDQPRSGPVRENVIRIDASKAATPAVKIIHGATTNADGPDYRGQQVVAAGSPVAGTDWFIGVKQSSAEAFAEARRSSQEIALLVAVFVLLLGLLGTVLIRRETARYYQERYEAEKARLEAAQQARRLNQLYAVLTECNAAAALEQSEEDLFRSVCQAAVGAGGFRLAWVGHVDTETHLVSPIVQQGPAAGYMNEVTILTEGETPYGRGPTGICVREHRAVTSTDFATDPVMKPWREAAARHGSRCSICMPLDRRGSTEYVFGLYAAEPGFFSDEEVRLAERVGASLSFALERLDLARERRHAEEERRRYQERLELAFEAAREAYFEYDAQTREIMVSPRWYTMLGYEPDSLTQAERRELIHPEERDTVDGYLVDAAEGRLPYKSFEFRVKNRDGEYRWLLGRIKAIVDPVSGKVTRVVGTREDITERKTLEQEFLQAQKMETVGRLAGGLAHDFNNHLTVINGYSGMLRRKLPADSPLLQTVETIRDAGERAATLTRRLLTFSRKEVEHRETIDLNGLVTGMEKILGQLTGKRIELSFDLAENTGVINADPGQIEQVLMNLVVNARDAIRETGRITVQTSRMAAAGSEGVPWVKLTVTDDGCGMSQELQRHIFEPFFTTKDSSKGTGLGLATVFAIVRRHGGSINVESEPGRGSSFHVWLPAEATGAPQQEKPQAPAELRGHETVLVIEDEPRVRELTMGILTGYGYNVLSAARGSEAVFVADHYREAIDLVVSDVLLPDMPGTETVKKLRLNRPGLTVLFVSGTLDETIDPLDLAGEATGFLPKPFTPESLGGKVRAMLSRRLEPMTNI